MWRYILDWRINICKDTKKREFPRKNNSVYLGVMFHKFSKMLRRSIKKKQFIEKFTFKDLIDWDNWIEISRVIQNLNQNIFMWIRQMSDKFDFWYLCNFTSCISRNLDAKIWHISGLYSSLFPTNLLSSIKETEESHSG